MADLVGKQFGNYRLIRLLGQGSFANVFLGENVYLGNQVAIKILHNPLTNESKDLKKFRAEARNLARLDHRYIVRLLDFGMQGDIPYLIMSYAPHGTLRQRYSPGNLPSLATIVRYISQITEALQYAHDEKLIHCDIKPENIFLGRQQEALLGDFGIARLSETLGTYSLRNVEGTVPYMAPEQIQESPHPASDQYALGVVVYEWLCGEHPFQGSMSEIALKHILTAPPSLCAKNPTLPESIEQIVFKALEKKPRNRFANVSEFARAFISAYEAIEGPMYKGASPPPTQFDQPPPLQETLPIDDISLIRTVRISKSSPILKNAVEVVNEGVEHHKAGRFQEAIAAYTRAIDLDPTYILAYYYRGSTYKSLKDFKQAIADYDRALALDSTSSKIYYHRGNAYYALKEYQQAIVDYTSYLQAAPKDAEAYYNRALAYYFLNEYQQAIDDFNEAVALKPRNVNSYIYRGNAYKALKDNEKALANYSYAIRLDAKHAEAYYERGNVYCELKKYREAIADFDRFLELEPKDADGYNNRGNAYLSIKEYSQALTDCNSAIDLASNNAIYYGSRGEVYFARKQYNLAIKDFDRALEIDPSYAWAKKWRQKAAALLPYRSPKKQS